MRRLVVPVALLLAACAPPPADSGHDAAVAAATAPAAAATAGDAHVAGMRSFRSDDWDFSIDYPAALTAHGDFGHGYLDNGTWKTYAAPDSKGTPVFALLLPGSDAVTAGELRIGVSDVPAEVDKCTMPPDAVRPDSTGTTRIGGAGFTTFEAADAAMSHYLSVRSYRSVHDGRCYAIDLLVTGTDPRVYDPPATPPFSRDQAFARLHKALEGFRFTD